MAKDLRPMQIAVIRDELMNSYIGNVVMRTQSLDQVEIMNLSRPLEDNCWVGGGQTFKVELLHPTQSITLSQTI
ncbi:hypothetical protein N8314_00800 [Akkermansiaceae bacterium]|nr:hypothetical protein [Akkermansiaceae bacterium]